MNESTWRRQLLLQIGGPVAAFLLTLAVWATAVWLFRIPPYVMPSPLRTWQAALSDWDTLVKGLRITFSEFLMGFLLGTVAGFCFAVIMDASHWVRGVLYPILIASQAVPIIAISAALTIWLGFGLAPKLFIVALTVFFPVVVNVLDGLAAVDSDMLNLVRSMGGTRFSIFRIVKLPSTYTPLFSALKLSATFSVTGAVIGEWTASTTGGLGAYLLQANSRLNTAATFSAIGFLAALGILAFVLVVTSEWMLTPWRTSSKARPWSPRIWRRNQAEMDIVRLDAGV